MCGIAGYIGESQAKEKLFSILKKLEYRGYDSSGMLLGNESENITIKSVGKISNLENKASTLVDDYSFGIAHTRWSTHGKPNEKNAHPIKNNKNVWSVVHNGIVENAQTLKRDLEKRGIKFETETDTEIVSNLLPNSTDIKEIIASLSSLSGSFALLMVNHDEKNTLYLAKNKSPLFVSLNANNEIFVASDQNAFSEYSDTFYSLENMEFCVAKKSELKFYDKFGKIIKKTPEIIVKNNFENILNINQTHMEKEILEIPKIIEIISEKYQKNNKIIKKISKFQKIKPNNIYLIGCGTAYHSGILGKYYFDYTHIFKANIFCYIASEFRFFSPPISKRDLCIFISQSGETADTLSCLEMCKNKKAKCISLTNNSNSSIARKSDMVFDIYAGQEVAVASTKAYVAQLLSFLILSKKKRETLFSAFLNLKTELENFLKPENTEKLSILSSVINTFEKVFFIGKGQDYITAQESSLKLKEVSYINSLAIPSGELKHGTLALIDEKTLVIVLMTNKNTYSKNINSISEIKARNGHILAISQFSETLSHLENGDYFIELPNLPEIIMPIVSILPCQLLALFSSLDKGLSPDMPRNLAKSVTVE